MLEKLGIVLPEKVESKPTLFTRFRNLQGKRFDPKCYLPENQAIYESLFQSKYEINALKALTIQSVAGDGVLMKQKMPFQNAL